MSSNKAKTQTELIRRSLVSSALLVMGATLASRALGVLREIVLANQFGTEPQYGAYKAAFRIPDTLYLLIIGGALGSSLIPVFSRFLGQNEPEKAWRLANTIVNYALLALAVSSALAWLFAPAIVSNLLAPNFPPEIRQLTTDLSRLLLLQPFFIGLGGIALALLNGSEQFVWPALAPLIYNASIIAGALLLTGPLGIYGVVWGVIIGAVLYLLVQLPALVRLGFYWRPGLERDTPGAGQVLRALGPRLLGQAAFQANFFVATNLASGLPDGPGRVAAFEYAYQLFMLPHGIFAISLATVAFPTMARLLGAGDLAGMQRTLVSSLRQLLFLTLPAAVGLALLARPVVASLLQWGRFDARSTDLVSPALVCFSVGLVSYGVVELVTRAFYALHDTRTPVLIALLTVALNIALSLALLGPLQHAGLALALALSTTVEMGLLLAFISPKLGALNFAGGTLLKPLLKIVAASAVMGLVLLGLLYLLQPALAEAGKLQVLLLTLLLIGAGGLVYILMAFLLRLEELRGTVRRFIRR